MSDERERCRIQGLVESLLVDQIRQQHHTPDVAGTHCRACSLTWPCSRAYSTDTGPGVYLDVTSRLEACTDQDDCLVVELSDGTRYEIVVRSEG